jgi:hypothetical protein
MTTDSSNKMPHAMQSEDDTRAYVPFSALSNWFVSASLVMHAVYASLSWSSCFSQL